MPHFILGTAGHIDHGKSSLVKALTGTDPDRFPEEKARGLTIDLGFAFATLPSGTEIAFVDLPGHVRFIKNMLAGVGAVDLAVLVVAATEGWMPTAVPGLGITRSWLSRVAGTAINPRRRDMALSRPSATSGFETTTNTI